MNVLLTSVVAMGALLGNAPVEKNWNKNYSAALEAARTAQRPLLVLIEDASQESGQQASLCTSESAEIGDLLAVYEVCRVDVNTQYGAKVAAAYRATQFPYTAISDSGCEQIVFRGAGQYSETTWQTMLGEYQDSSADRVVARKPTLPRPTQELFGHANLESAMLAARELDRRVLAFVTMDGCHYCEKMKAEMRDDPTVESMIKERFESVIVHQTSNPAWIAEQGVRIYPSTLVLGQEGQLIGRIDGYASPTDLLDLIHNNKANPSMLSVQ
jgi:hypothetical protein